MQMDGQMYLPLNILHVIMQGHSEYLHIQHTNFCFQVVCNPKDSSVIVIVGPQLFRMLSVTEGTWYQYGWSKPESLRITSVAWLSSDHVIGGTSDGNLLLVDSGELTAIYKAMTLTTIDINMRKE
jgi:hypothetical protein